MASTIINKNTVPIFLAMIEESLRQIPSTDFQELKSSAKPPLCCLAVLEGVGILLNPAKQQWEWTDDKNLMSGITSLTLTVLFGTLPVLSCTSIVLHKHFDVHKVALSPLTIPQENIYLLKFILHNYDDEKVPSICGVDKTRNQHPPNIFIIACVISPDGDISKWQAHAMDWATATLFNKGQERTLDEYQRLRKQAGFDYQQFYPPQVPPEVQNLPVCAYGRVGKILQT
ncbi:unnamed protein product [Rotaria socialis]